MIASLYFLLSSSSCSIVYACKWLQFLDLVELNLKLQFYLVYTKTSTIVQIIEEKEWRRKLMNKIKIVK